MNKNRSTLSRHDNIEMTRTEANKLEAKYLRWAKQEAKKRGLPQALIASAHEAARLLIERRLAREQGRTPR